MMERILSDPQEQMNTIISAIEADPQPPHNWLNLGGIFLSNKMWEPLLSMFEQREIMLKDGAVLMFQMLFSETVAKVPQLHTALAQYEGKDFKTNLQLVLQYASGAMKINSGDIEGGMKSFENITKAINESDDLGKNIPHLNDLEWLIKQYKTKEEIDKFQTLKPKFELENMEWIGEIDTGKLSHKPVMFAACDSKYFDKFADEFIELLQGFGPIHIHIVNGDKEKLKSFITERPTENISLSTERYNFNGGSPYFASVRFLRVGDVMSKFNRDVVMLDIDMGKLNDFDRLLEISRARGITLFKDLSIIPWLRHWATYIYYKNTDVTKAYQTIMKNTLLHTLDGAKWFIDQSILNCVNQYCEDKLGESHIQYLEEKSGFKLFDYIAPSGTIEEKREMRDNADYT